MAKTFNSEKVMTFIFTKDEIRFIKAQGWKLYPTRRINWYTETADYDSEKDCEKDCKAREKALRKQLSEAFRYMGMTVDGKWIKTPTLAEWIKADDERIKFEKRMEREDAAINAQMKDSGLHSVWSVINTYKTGENTEGFKARYGQENGIKCDERSEKYANSCKFMKIVRSFTLYVRKGWNVCKVGGLITFYKGEFDRTGMACEWIEQGISIDSFRTVKGFLVRGEHIEAKNLKEAKAINANHRAMQMARLLNARKRQERRQQQKANGTLMITFQDSLNSGNCRPGTQQFKQQYEEAIGHEAKSISIADLRKYGKLFGVEYYAEKAIEYALNH